MKAEGPDTAYKMTVLTLGVPPAAAPTCLPLQLSTVKEQRKSFTSQADGELITLL